MSHPQRRSSVWPLVVLLGGVVLAYQVGAKQQQGLSTTHVLGLGPGVLRVEYVPDPRDIVNLKEGEPYTVPAGKLLIITDYTVTNAVSGGNIRFSLAPRIRIDGTAVWGTGWAAPNDLSPMSPDVLSYSLRSGIRADAGSSVSLHANWWTSSSPWGSYMGMTDAPVMFASGYLVDAE